MACENCGSGNGSHGDCSSCSSGGGCGGGGKLDVFDWLSNMNLPNGQDKFDCVEVRFKNDRKEFFRNTENLSLYVGDTVAVEAKSGHDVGTITLVGELVRIQMKKKKIKDDPDRVPKVYRKANQRDIETWQEYREKEDEIKMKARKIATSLGLEMKISDVEYQGDGTKAIFYYTADGRVDFRELIRKYASAFRVRIEMKQIGYRQEAAKIGGISSSGRELCCSTWLTDFRSVSTSAARYQQLSINPQKLTGQCGKLKCCLNFELDSYLDALEDFPPENSYLNTENGSAHCVKIDVFKKEMWFSYDEGAGRWFGFPVSLVKNLIADNKKGGKTPPLEDLAKNLEDNNEKAFTDIIEENSLERFERKRKKSKRRKKRSNKKGFENNSKPGKRQGKRKNKRDSSNRDGKKN